MNRDFTKNEKEKSQYQDTICSDEIIDPATSQLSEETSRAFPLAEKRFLQFFGADDCWKHLSTLVDTIFVFRQ